MISSTLLGRWAGVVSKLCWFWFAVFFSASCSWPGRGTGTPAHVIGPHVVSSDSIRLRKIREIDGAFGGLTNLAVDINGYIYVTDVVNQEIKAFSLDGRLLHTIGRKGQGPGEFTGLLDLAISRDSLYAFDNNLKHISVYHVLDTLKFEYTNIVL